MPSRRRYSELIRRTLLALALVACSPEHASAFFFPRWPGAEVPSPAPEPFRARPPEPNETPMPIYNPFLPNDLLDPVQPEPPPPVVPEPASVLTGLIGIGIAAAYHRRRSSRPTEAVAVPGLT